MYKKIIKQLTKYIKIYIKEENLYKIQRKLIDSGIFLKTEELIAGIIILMGLIFLITLIISLTYDLTPIMPVLSTITLPVMIIFYIHYKNEKRLEEIELELPDYLRQLSSLIKIGYGLESAFNELSKTINNSLNNEIKRALLETSFGKPFNEALMEVAEKNNSKNLKHTFQLIIHTWESGGNIADVLESIANDLSDSIMLKKERKAGVMMSVMFLIISSVIATPFALGMIQLYIDFINSSGRTNPLIDVIPVTSMGYVIIQALLVCLLIGVVMYSDSKKGIKYMIIIIPSAIIIYYSSQFILSAIMGI